MTTGLTLFGVITVGACPNRDRGVAAATPATAVVRTKSRRFSFFITPQPIQLPNYPITQLPNSPGYIRGDYHTLGLGGALINFRRAYVAEQPLDDRAAAISRRREDLHRLVRRPVRRLRGRELRHRRLQPRPF